MSKPDMGSMHVQQVIAMQNASQSDVSSGASTGGGGVGMDMSTGPALGALKSSEISLGASGVAMPINTGDALGGNPLEQAFSGPLAPISGLGQHTGLDISNLAKVNAGASNFTPGPQLNAIQGPNANIFNQGKGNEGH
jgi:hypothetical protein